MKYKTGLSIQRPEAIIKLSEQNTARMKGKKMIVYPGTPIMRPNGKMVWAYFATEHAIDITKPYPFKTSSALLEVDTFSEITGDPNDLNTVYQGFKRSDRETAILYRDGRWLASYDCCQQDFAENPLFHISEVSGPESVRKAIGILLQDPNFKRYASTPGFQAEGETIVDTVIKYRDFYNEYDRRNA